MEQKIKKIVIMLLVVVLVVNNVTYQNRVEVKAALPVVMSAPEIMSLLIGGGASATCLTNGQSSEAEFKRAYQNYLNSLQAQNDAVASAFGNTDAGLAVAAVATMPQYYMDYAWQQYQTEDGREWGNVGDSGMSWPEIWAEINDQDVSNYDLYARMMKNQNNPEDPEHNDKNTKGVVKFLAFMFGTFGIITAGKLGYDVWQTNQDITQEQAEEYIKANTINPDTGAIENGCNGHESDEIESYVVIVNYENKGIKYKDYWQHIGKRIGAYRLSDLQLMILGVQGEVQRIYDFYQDGKLLPNRHTDYKNTFGGSINLYTPYKGTFQTDLPIFANADELDKYINGEIGIEDAENYQEPTEEQKQLQEIIDMFNQLLNDMENDGLEKPYKNILEAMQDQIKDMFNDLKDEVTPDTTPEEVKDKVKDRIKKDIEDVEPIVNPVENPVPVPTNTPLPTEVPKPTTTDSTKEEQQMQLGGVITDVFPFCIPFDLIYVVRTFKAEPKIPHFEIPIVFEPLGLNYIWVIDFARFEPFAKVFRWFALLSYITSLILVTRKLIKG